MTHFGTQQYNRKPRESYWASWDDKLHGVECTKRSASFYHDHGMYGLPQVSLAHFSVSTFNQLLHKFHIVFVVLLTISAHEPSLQLTKSVKRRCLVVWKLNGLVLQG